MPRRRLALALAGLAAFALLTIADGSRALARVTADAAGPAAPAAGKHSGGIVASITKSPVSPDGNVAGARTDLVINLNVSMDPADPGFTFSSGDVVKVTLPEGFIDTGAFEMTAGGPFCFDSDGNPVCNGVVMLQGFPQYPAVPFSAYTPSFDPETRVITMQISDPALGAPGGAAFFGVKQLHLLLPGFTNPTRPGKHRIELTIERASGGVESGWADADIRPHVEPSIQVTSVVTDGDVDIPPPARLNPLYQSTPGLRPVTFLLWDRQGQPFLGVSLEARGNGGYRLVQDGHTVGQVSIDGPKRGDLAVVTTVPSFAFDSPITRIPTGRLIVEFVPGTIDGVYTVTFSLNGGNDVTFVITAS